MRLLVLALAGLSAINFCGNGLDDAYAQTWPTQTVKIVTPFPPGSGGDVTARPLADRLAKHWGKPVIVENRPGADGIPAAAAFVAARDNHTLMFSFAGLITINPYVHDKLPYDPDRKSVV